MAKLSFLHHFLLASHDKHDEYSRIKLPIHYLPSLKRPH